jgi:hypothetical protein
MALTFANGTPDSYLDGPRADLWVEFKAFAAMPRSGIVCCAPVPDVKKQPKGHLTPLQSTWLGRRWAHGANAVVVAGLPNKRAVLMTSPSQWLIGVPVEEAITIDEVAKWICEFCGECSSRQSRSCSTRS